jgi:hypothetical protein
MYLPYSNATQFASEKELEESVRHRRFSLNGPPWYNPTIRIKGRRYVIPWHGQGYWGDVVVDDVKHVVFILTSYS